MICKILSVTPVKENHSVVRLVALSPVKRDNFVGYPVYTAYVDRIDTEKAYSMLGNEVTTGRPFRGWVEIKM